MIELKKLQELTTYARLGSLSAAAEALHTSQPALSRSMKQLEEELGVPLFIRGKNRITLTKTGKEAVNGAQQVLNAEKSFRLHITAFDRSLHTITISYCAPVPQMVLTPLLTDLFEGQRISSIVSDDARFLEDLRDGTCQLAVIHWKPEDPDFYAVKIGTETIFLSVTPSNPLAFKPQLSLKDLDGMAILLRNRLGFWRTVIDRGIRNAHFLLQVDPDAFLEIAKHSEYPYFTSTYSQHFFKTPPGRLTLPFTDPSCRADYYLVSLRKNKKRFQPLWKSVNEKTIH